RPFRRRLAGAALLALLGSLPTFAILPLFGRVEEAIIANDRRLLGLAMLGYAGVLLLDVFAKYWIRICRTRVSTFLDQELLTDYYRKVLNMSVEDFLAFKQRSNLYQRVIDAMAVTGQFTDVVIHCLQSVIFVIVIMVVVGALSITVLEVLLAGSVILFTFVFAETSRLRTLHTRTLAVNYPLVAKMLEIVDGIFTIKALAATVGVTEDIGRLVGARKDAEYLENVVDARATHGALAIRTVGLVLALGTS